MGQILVDEDEYNKLKDHFERYNSWQKKHYENNKQHIFKRHNEWRRNNSKQVNARRRVLRWIKKGHTVIHILIQ